MHFCTRGNKEDIEDEFRHSRQARILTLLSVDLEQFREKREGRKISSEIDDKIKKEYKSKYSVQKLLLLGIGESGKSTFAKQMKILHIKEGFTDEEKDMMKGVIYRNFTDANKILLQSIEESETMEVPQGIKQIIMSETEQTTKPESYYDAAHRLWTDSQVQSAYTNNTLPLNGNVKYWLDRLPWLRQADYTATNTDMLHARLMTTSIHKLEFEVNHMSNKVQFEVIDVGGQKGEQRKWIHLFQDVKAIIFLADISCFDNKEQFKDTIDTFKKVWNNRYLNTVNVLLFLNKIDLVQDKIQHNKSIEQLKNDLSQEDPLYEYFQTWETWSGPTDDEEKEFLQAYPVDEKNQTDDADIEMSSRKGSRSSQGAKYSFSLKGRKSSSKLPKRTDVLPETVKTAVFIKNLFKELMKEEQHGVGWHSKHYLKFFYTCAVDTQTVKNVFEGVKSFIIIGNAAKW